MKTRIRALTAILISLAAVTLTGCNKNPLAGKCYTTEMQGSLITLNFIDDTNIEMTNSNLSAEMGATEKVVLKGTYTIGNRLDTKYFETSFETLQYLMNDMDLTSQMIPAEYMEQYVTSMNVAFLFGNQTKETIDLIYAADPMTFTITKSEAAPATTEVVPETAPASEPSVEETEESAE